MVKLLHPTRRIKAEIALPGSKSESNRAIIINALSGNKINISNLSTARDTTILQGILADNGPVADVQDAGTAMRFLTAYYAALNQPKIITGNQRMQERPIAPLVTALRGLGYQVIYPGKKGFPPVEIQPVDVSWLDNEALIEGNVSSQFITALLLIAPFQPNGLSVEFTTELTSKPYVEMTLGMLGEFGVNYTWHGNKITVQPATINSTAYLVGADWSSASYWYAMAFLADEAEIYLKGLKNSWSQGDRITADWMKRFGVVTEFDSGGALLRKTEVNYPKIMKLNFKDNPDLAQTFAAMFAAKNIISTFTGLDSLRIKETDRVAALHNELQKAGIKFEFAPMYEFYQLKGQFNLPPAPINTYHDHRMAMSFACWALMGEIQIENPAVVDKSYPTFWSDLAKAGFAVGS